MNRFEELVYGIVERIVSRLQDGAAREGIHEETTSRHIERAATTESPARQNTSDCFFLSDSPLPATFRAAAACALRLLACHHAHVFFPGHGRKHVGLRACTMHPFNACLDHTTRQDFLSFSSLLSSTGPRRRRRRPRRRISRCRRAKERKNRGTRVGR